MVQKSEKSSGLKAAEGIKAEKPKFHKPKTEGIQISPEKQKELDDKLLDATKEGKEEKILRLLNYAGADVDAKDKDNVTALMWAAQKGHRETCVILIDNGADIDAKDKEGKTALINAVLTDNTEICELLVIKIADVTAKDKWGKTALDYAKEKGNEKMINLLS